MLLGIPLTLAISQDIASRYFRHVSAFAWSCLFKVDTFGKLTFEIVGKFFRQIFLRRRKKNFFDADIFFFISTKTQKIRKKLISRRFHDPGTISWSARSLFIQSLRLLLEKLFGSIIEDIWFIRSMRILRYNCQQCWLQFEFLL